MKLQDRVQECAASPATESGVTIEHISKSQIRNEDVVARVLEAHGDRPEAASACTITSTFRMPNLG